MTARGGVQWTPWRQLILRGGYSFRPSALSGTSGFSNYVDTDAHLISLGAGTEVSNPLQAQARPLSLALATQVTLLKDVSVQQDRPGPVGDFSGGGQILTIALTAQQAF